MDLSAAMHAIVWRLFPEQKQSAAGLVGYPDRKVELDGAVDGETGDKEFKLADISILEFKINEDMGLLINRDEFVPIGSRRKIIIDHLKDIETTFKDRLQGLYAWGRRDGLTENLIIIGLARVKEIKSDNEYKVATGDLVIFQLELSKDYTVIVKAAKYSTVYDFFEEVGKQNILPISYFSSKKRGEEVKPKLDLEEFYARVSERPLGKDEKYIPIRHETNEPIQSRTRQLG